jgi:hypothetical protein
VTAQQKDAQAEVNASSSALLDLMDEGRPPAELERAWVWHEAAWDNYLAGYGVHPASR